ncbi:MAG: ribulose-phosphate 3-epimerase [Actinomycetota bacterium]|jgi:ribulose-phosphate 3-epimerase|nr:ribulose-phosphate 3-epimerase [Actinomycetota bacterium]
MGGLSASILGADLAYLGDQVKAVEPFVDALHIDIMDGHFVPPIALGTVVVAALRPLTRVRFHGHLMVDAPMQYFDELSEAGLDMVSFHLEAVPEPGPAIAKARGAGMGVGLTINLETPVEAVAPYLEDIDDLMLMSIAPGWSGQTLNPSVYPRLQEARRRIDAAGLTVALEIDGGVKIENARTAVEAGASVLIAASGIFGEPDPAGAAKELAMIAEGAA